MANHFNPRRKRKRKTERRLSHGCSGKGHNGAIGRSVWKKLSRRSARRAKGVRIPKVSKFKGGRPKLPTE